MCNTFVLLGFVFLVGCASLSHGERIDTPTFCEAKAAEAQGPTIVTRPAYCEFESHVIDLSHPCALPCSRGAAAVQIFPNSHERRTLDLPVRGAAFACIVPFAR
jgi:hypothetical protein